MDIVIAVLDAPVYAVSVISVCPVPCVYVVILSIAAPENAHAFAATVVILMEEVAELLLRYVPEVSCACCFASFMVKT